MFGHRFLWLIYRSESESLLTRGATVMGAMRMGAVIGTRASLAKASLPTTPVDFEVPANACDCHTHIHADPGRFPFFSGRVYTPEVASPGEMLSLHRKLHLQRVVVVTPSVYGTDNSATVYGVKTCGVDARGVAVIDDKTPDSDLDAMHQAGMRGIRLNFVTTGMNDPNHG